MFLKAIVFFNLLKEAFQKLAFKIEHLRGTLWNIL